MALDCVFNGRQHPQVLLRHFTWSNKELHFQRFPGGFRDRFTLWAVKSRRRRRREFFAPCPCTATNIHINSSTKSPHPSGHPLDWPLHWEEANDQAENSLLILIYFLQDPFSHSQPSDRIFTLPQTPSSTENYFHFLILPCPKKSDLEGCRRGRNSDLWI